MVCKAPVKRQEVCGCDCTKSQDLVVNILSSLAPPPKSILRQCLLELLVTEFISMCCVAGNQDGGYADNLQHPFREDIVIHVTDPLKQGEGMNAYIKYKIITKCRENYFKSSEFSAVRRFR